jgi:hypothetical protein
MRAVSTLVGLVVLVLASGCASYSWYHPNVPPELIARDEAECREQARQLVTLELMDDPFWWDPGFRHRRGLGLPVTTGLAMEQDVFNRCMRFKGYALVKDPRAPSGGP